MSIWDKEDPLRRMQGETIRANQALKDYANLGLGRSLTKLAHTYVERAIHGGVPPTKHRTVLAGWSAKFFWQERVGDWQQADQEIAAIRMAARYQEMQQRILTLSEALMQKAEEMAKWPIARQRTQKDGVSITIEPAKWDFGTPAQFVKTTHELFALINGKPTAHLKIEDIEHMTDDQLREYLSKRVRNRTEGTGESLAGSGTPGNEPAGDSEPDPSSGTIH